MTTRPTLPLLIATSALSALLAGCGSTPLPPWPSSSTAPRPTAPAPLPAQRGTVVPSTGAPQPGVTITPLGREPLPQGAPEAGLTDNAAVAARFPDPAVRYDTPGLADGRRSFTTNDEASAWLLRLAARSAAPGGTRLAVLPLGRSQRGTPLQALLATRAQGTSPDSLDATHRPTVVLIGGQRGDEPASTEALLVIARELAPGGLLEPLLDRINVIAVPRANPDAAELGQRATANGTNLERDHLLLATPEAQALAVLVRNYRPIAVLDAREYPAAGDILQKFHALPRQDALLQYATVANEPEFITKAANEWFYSPMMDALRAQSLTSEWYYTTTPNPEDLRIAMGVTQPDASVNANGLKNAVSLLVATRGAGLGRAHIQRRVHTQVTALSSALRSAADRAANLGEIRSYVNRDVSALACKGPVVVDAGPTPSQRDLTLIDPDTGMDRTTRVDLDSSRPLRPLKTRARPCGYWLSANTTTAVERLRLLGVQVMHVVEPGNALAETSADPGSNTPPARAALDIPADSYYVPLNQSLANLAVAALEPDAPGGYLANHLIPSPADTARIMVPPSLVFDEQD
ncbi:MAG: M14 family metallocarboxypeptidase [Acidovorax sp.]